MTVLYDYFESSMSTKSTPCRKSTQYPPEESNSTRILYMKKEEINCQKRRQKK